MTLQNQERKLNRQVSNKMGKAKHSNMNKMLIGDIYLLLKISRMDEISDPLSSVCQKLVGSAALQPY